MNMKEMFDLKGRVALITGGAGLLGTHHAEILAEAGANIVIFDIDKKTCEEKAGYISDSFSVDCLGIAVDITDKESVERGFKKVMDKFGRVDILINNAAMTLAASAFEGLDFFAPFEDYPLEIWKKALDVNLTGMFLVTQQAVKVMKEQKSGVIINISSTYGNVSPDHRIYEGIKNPYGPGNMGSPLHYAVSKSGVLNFTRWLATYLAPYNIRVNTLTPGGVFHKHDKKFVDNYSNHVPLGRMADEEDYKGAILFLASDASSYMTGSNMIVDGGWTCW